MKHLLSLILPVVGLLAASPAAAASFNCAKAATPVEKAICADPALSKLDGELAKAYRAAADEFDLDLKDPSDARAASFRAKQAEWLKQRDACGPQAACLRRQYQRRLAVLSFKPDPDAPAKLDRFLGRYDGTTGSAAASIFRLTSSEVLVRLIASEPTQGRWTCDLRLQGYLNAAGDLDAETDEADVLTFKVKGDRLAIVQEEGTLKVLSEACGSGGMLPTNYVRAK